MFGLEDSSVKRLTIREECGRICMAFGIMTVMPYCKLIPGHVEDHEAIIGFGDGSHYKILWRDAPG